MDARLRSSAAHVVVADVAVPQLDDVDQHHLHRVLRLRDGAAVTVTDGAGAWRPCRWERGSVTADGDVEHVAPPSVPLTIAVAPPKGDRLELLVQKVTEIGVDRIVLLEAERSVVKVRGDRWARQHERLVRITRQAVMQSRRVFVPIVEPPQAACSVVPTIAVAEPGGRPLVATDDAVAVGPEGGWSEREVASAADTVTLGPHILRVETAAIVAATLLVAGRDR